MPERLAEALREAYPGIQIVGTYSPPFRPLTPEEDEAIVTRINESEADIVWVGLSTPKQEYWIASQRATLDVPLVLGVGAAFDFHAGTKKWAPLWIRKLGLEWAFRMVTGGPRTFLKNTKFVSVMLCALAAAMLERLTGKHRRVLDQGQAMTTDE